MHGALLTFNGEKGGMMLHCTFKGVQCFVFL
jgi:hypothetical protein